MSRSNRRQPDATEDLNCARADIDKFGYCLLKGALSPDELAAIRTRLLEQKEAEEQLGVEYHGEDKKQLIKFLLNKIFHWCFQNLSIFSSLSDKII